MVDNNWFEGLRAEYRYNLLCADLHARIRDLRAVMARRDACLCALIIAAVTFCSVAVGVGLPLWLLR